MPACHRNGRLPDGLFPKPAAHDRCRAHRNPPPSQGNDTANGGFWYQDLAVTYLGPGNKANEADPTVSLTVESPILNCELPATVEAIARTSFDNFIPGQQLSVDLSYGPVSPGPNQPCTYSVWRASPVSPA